MITDPKISTRVVHSKTQSAWNVIGATLGAKLKIARCPYVICGDDFVDSKNREEAFEHAQFISYCFNNSQEIVKIGNQ